MIICVPSMDRWENNPIYEKVVKYAKNKERFLFFVRPYQVEQYRSYMTDVTVIPISEECVNIGTTRRWIDNYMRSCGVFVYCQMDDRISSIGVLSFDDNGAPKISSKEFNKENIDTILDSLYRFCTALIRKYPQIAIMSIRRRGFANTVSPKSLVELNSSIAQIDDVLIVNTSYPLENIPFTDTFAEDANFSVAAISKERYIGVIHGFVRDTDESFPSRCTSDTGNRHRVILEELPSMLDKEYSCSQWLSIEWNKKRTFPVFKIIHKNSPVPRIKMSVSEILDIMEVTK